MTIKMNQIQSSYHHHGDGEVGSELVVAPCARGSTAVLINPHLMDQLRMFLIGIFGVTRHIEHFLEIVLNLSVPLFVGHRELFTWKSAWNVSFIFMLHLLPNSGMLEFVAFSPSLRMVMVLWGNRPHLWSSTSQRTADLHKPTISTAEPSLLQRNTNIKQKKKNKSIKQTEKWPQEKHRWSVITHLHVWSPMTWRNLYITETRPVKQTKLSIETEERK